MPIFMMVCRPMLHSVLDRFETSLQPPHRTHRIASTRFGRWLALFIAVVSPVRAAFQLDATFVHPVFEDAYFLPSVFPLAAADGSVLVANTGAYVNGVPSRALLRFTSTGGVDSNFQAPDYPTGAFFVYAYEDGRSLVYNGTDRILRLLPNGNVDASFTSLTVSSSPSFNIRGTKGPNGRILLWGNGLNVDGRSFAMSTQDGGIDATFKWPAGYDAFPGDVAFQADGKLLLGGVVAPGPRYLSLGRFEANGAFDPTFDPGAGLPVGGSSTRADVMAVLPDGRILVGNYLQVVRLLPDGARDATYLPSYGVASVPSSLCRATASGKFYFAGSHWEQSRWLDDQLRLNADGTTDATFRVTFESTSSNGAMKPVSWDDEVLYYAVPVTAARAAKRYALSRATYRDGLDLAFAPRFSRAADLTKVIRQPDGKYLVAGSFDFVNGVALTGLRTPCLVRIGIDGTLDRTFVAPASFVRDETVIYVAPLGVQPDGRVIVHADGGIRRLNIDGSFDVTFPTLSGTTAQLDARGRIYVPSATLVVSRYNADGGLDSGYTPVPTTGMFFVAGDGRVVLATQNSRADSYAITRAGPDGILDLSYHNEIAFSRPGMTFSVLADGSLVSCGEIQVGAQYYTTALRFTRLDPAGLGVTQVDVPRERQAAMAEFVDLMRAGGGGAATLAIKDLGSIQVSGNDALLLPSRLILGDEDFFPMARFHVDAGTQMSVAPVICLQPSAQNPRRGTTTWFSVQNYGASPCTYQWFKDGVAVTDAHAQSGNFDQLVFPNTQAANVGRYWVVITNEGGTVTSDAVRLDLLVAPALIQSPLSVTVSPNQTLALSVGVTGTGLKFLWTKDGLAYSTPYDSAAPLTGVSTVLGPALAGTYVCTISNGGGSVRTTPAVVTLSDTDDVGRMTNVSVRTASGLGDQVLIMGFGVSGNTPTATLPLLVRAAGPALVPFEVNDYLADPMITIRTNAGQVDLNDDWGGTATIVAVAKRVGAFPFVNPGSKDAAIYRTDFKPDSYTVQVDGVGRTTGTAVAEIYDATSGPPAVGGRLTNVSCRALVSNDSALIAGFYIAGSTARTVLVRAVGEGLVQFGVSGVLASGELTIKNSTGTIVAFNAGASGDPVTVAAAKRTGAFSLPSISNDNAIVVTLPPGSYTAQVAGTNKATGIALIEVYDLP